MSLRVHLRILLLAALPDCRWRWVNKRWVPSTRAVKYISVSHWNCTAAIQRVNSIPCFSSLLWHRIRSMNATKTEGSTRWEALWEEEKATGTETHANTIHKYIVMNTQNAWSEFSYLQYHHNLDTQSSSSHRGVYNCHLLWWISWSGNT